MIGRQLGHYRVLRELGEGGMSQVYVAEDLKLDRRVALKVLPPNLAGDPDRLSRFTREAQILAGLSHPNIVTIFSVEQDQGVPFLTMELVEGTTLAELIRGGDLSGRQCRDIAIAVAEALAAAHAREIVHRDLKPANIMVSNQGRVKVLDFGLAKAAALADGLADAPTMAQTRDGLILGTIPYMSPEQVEGAAVDARSDFFSLGVTLYEMTTGAHPFPGPSAAHVMAAILRDRKTTVDGLRPGLSAAWERIITRCMERDPARRYQSAEQLGQDLVALPAEASRGLPVVRHIRRLARAVQWRGAALLTVAVIAGAAIWSLRGARAPEAITESAGHRTMVVVLPFENLGAADYDYFVAGLTEEISSRLGRVGRIGLISRQTALQYAGTTKSARQIGEELGVEYLLGGTVRWSSREGGGSRVRITPQLIRTTDDTGIWVQTFDRVIDDVFELQSEIADEIFAKLGVTLGGPERQSLATQTTANLEAYQTFLRGRFQKQVPDYSADYRTGIIDMFAKSVALDPSFVPAYLELSLAHSMYYHLGHDRSGTRRTLAKDAAFEALSRSPEAPEVHLALGFYYYWVEEQYTAALSEFDLAEAGLPSSSEVLEAKALVLRRQGRWNEALDDFRLALKLNPRDASLLGEVAETQVNTRDFRGGIQTYDRAIALAPDQAWLYMGKAWAYWIGLGSTIEARATLDKMPATGDAQAVWMRFWQEIFESQPRAALRHLEGFPGEWLAFTESYSPKALLAGHAYRYLGDAAAARAAYDEARVMLEPEVAKFPDDPRRQSALGIAYAGLGRRTEAIQAGQRAVDLHPMSKDAFSGAYYASELAFIHALVGEHDLAIDRLEELLALPSLISVPIVRLDPRWATLANEPRFQALLRAGK